MGHGCVVRGRGCYYTEIFGLNDYSGEFRLLHGPVLWAGAWNLENFLKETVSPSLPHESTPKVLGQHPPAPISGQDLLFLWLRSLPVLPSAH